MVGLLEGNSPECQPTVLERAGESRVRDARAPRCSWPGWGPAVCSLSPRLPDSEASLFLIPRPLASRSPWQAELGPCRGQRTGAGEGAGHCSPRAFSLLPVPMACAQQTVPTSVKDLLSQTLPQSQSPAPCAGGRGGHAAGCTGAPRARRKASVAARASGCRLLPGSGGSEGSDKSVK